MEVIVIPLVSDAVALTWTNFSVYPSETEFGSRANSDNEILLMPGNVSISVSGSVYISVLACSSSANNGKFCVPNLLNISTQTTLTWTNGELT